MKQIIVTISVGIAIIDCFFISRQDVKSIVLEMNSKAMASSTIAQITTFCNNNGFIDSKSITKDQILQAAKQIMAEQNKVEPQVIQASSTN